MVRSNMRRILRILSNLINNMFFNIFIKYVTFTAITIRIFIYLGGVYYCEENNIIATGNDEKIENNNTNKDWLKTVIITTIVVGTITALMYIFYNYFYTSSNGGDISNTCQSPNVITIGSYVETLSAKKSSLNNYDIKIINEVLNFINPQFSEFKSLNKFLVLLDKRKELSDVNYMVNIYQALENLIYLQGPLFTGEKLNKYLELLYAEKDNLKGQDLYHSTMKMIIIIEASKNMYKSWSIYNTDLTNQAEIVQSIISATKKVL